MFHFLRKLVILSNAKDLLHNFALFSVLLSYPLRLSGTPPIIMVYASKLRENRFVKFISFDDSKHPCHNFCS